MRRLLGVLIAVIALWMGLVGPSPTAATPKLPTSAHTYDASPHSAQFEQGVSNRGPPARRFEAPTEPADDPRSPAGLSRSSMAGTAIVYAYDGQALLADNGGFGARPGVATSGHARAIEGDLLVLRRTQVAAKNADEGFAGVDDVLGGLAPSRQPGYKTVGSDSELQGVYNTLSRGGRPVEVPGYKGSWVERADGVRIGLRDVSKTGGRTIDVRYPDGTIRKVHIE